MQLKAVASNFVNAERVREATTQVPEIILSFERREDRRIIDIALNSENLRELICNSLCEMAYQGDNFAETVLHFIYENAPKNDE